jgi:putative transposase
MFYHKSHKIKLYPTKEQEIFFVKSCGASRFSYNWALARWKELYEKGEKCSAYTLDKEMRKLKYTIYPWMKEVGKCCHQYSIFNLEKAYKNFFKKRAKYPKYKKRGINDSFVAAENDLSFQQENCKLWVPRLGYVKCAETLRFEDAKVLSVKIKRQADIWFAIISCEVQGIPKENTHNSENQVVTGIDLGISNLVVTSEGKIYENAHILKSKLRLLKIRQQSLSRKPRGSNNYKKQRVKLSRLYYRISCIRSNYLHNITREIVNNSDVIVLEDLNVKGMVKNRHLSQAISDCSFSEIRRQITYKSLWDSKEVVIADRFFPSTKTCSVCGSIKADIKLGDKIYVCNNCNVKLDRDLNAALNLKQYFLTTTLKSRESKASGVRSSFDSLEQSSLTMKEEVNLQKGGL